MQNIKICIPVIGRNLEEFLENLNKIQKICDCVELRVDYIKNLKIKDIEVIKNEVKKEAIFTCRKKDEGGKFAGSEKERLEILEKALELDFDYVDIELSSINQINLSAKNKEAKIICSYHNFKKTPDYKELEIIANQMREYKASVLKIATMSHNEEDNRKLFKLLLNKCKEEKMIVLGMGEVGKITRILLPLLGGYLTYANIDSSEIAPGQINIEELENIYKSFPLL